MTAQELLKHLIVSKQGQFIYFVIEASEPLPIDTAKELQRLAGYDIRGYSMWRFKCLRIAPDRVLNTWSCSASCE